VLVESEQCPQTAGLLVGEEVRAGMQRPARGVERVALTAAMAVDGLLHPAPAPVQRVAGLPDHLEGIHDRDRVGQHFGGSGLQPGEPVHRDDLDAVAPRLRTGGEPGLEHLLGTALACRAAALALSCRGSG